MAFYNHEDSLVVQEQYVQYLAENVLENCKLDLEALGRDTTALEKIKAPFPRISYTDAIELLHKKGFDDIEWGDDFGSPHETEIANSFDQPVFIVNYPKAIKSFYMSTNPEDPRTVLCADLIAPEGYGEIIGGSERISDYDELKERIVESGLNADLRMVLRLAQIRYGSAFRIRTWSGTCSCLVLRCAARERNSTVPKIIKSFIPIKSMEILGSLMSPFCYWRENIWLTII